MLEILLMVFFVWLLWKAIGLALRLTWGAAKIVASILMVAAIPILVICFIFLGGIALMVPIALIAIAVGILKACT